MIDDFIRMERPKRWDVPFGADMTDADANEVLTIPPFATLDADKFPPTASLWSIVRYDTRVLRYRAGDVIVRQGDYGNSAFFVLDGSVRALLDALPDTLVGRRQSKRKSLWQTLAQLWQNPRLPEVRDVEQLQHPHVTWRDQEGATRLVLQDLPAVLDQCRTARLGAGEMFGELAALGRTPRTTTVVADGDARLLEVRWQGLRDIMRRDDALRQHIDQLFRARALQTFLDSAPFFRHLDRAALARVATGTLLESYGRYDDAGSFKDVAAADPAAQLANEPVIAEEGHYPNGVILIRSGLARVSQRVNHGHRTVSYLVPGQAFGFEEIVDNWRRRQALPLRYTLWAVGYVNVVVVPTAIVEEFVLARLPPQRRPLPLLRAPGPDPPSRPAKIGPEMLEFLVERRFINGTATMLIDLNRCTRCDDCVRACAATHNNNPRFLRHGPTHGHHMVANACMHCLDPVCMIECPTGAIHRETIEGRVVINDRTCIGCSACARNCPYDAIRMVEIRDRSGALVLDRASHQPITKATKCDLCVDQYGGPACERACPHDALKRTDMRDTEALASWLNR